MMKSPCLPYECDFFSMDSKKMDALIVNMVPSRVDELMTSGEGLLFYFT